ncbi:MAG: major capsid protein V20 domain-containing protein, partial [Candidatus Fonsibacter sp.]
MPTTGTILVLNCGKVTKLTEEHYAPGSLGTFNLQLTVHVQKQPERAFGTK